MGSKRQDSESCSSAPPTDGFEPTTKKRRLDVDVLPRQSRSQYENITAQGNSRNVWGDIINASSVHFHGQPTGYTNAHESHDDSDSAAQIMQALSFEQMDDRLETISKAHAKTCHWLFVREEYKTWRDPGTMDTHHGFFWIKGKPGAGKSTLMKCAKKFGEEQHEDLVISYFFNARGEELERSVEGMYRSLLCQLLEKKPELSSAMMRHKKRLVLQKWSVNTLKDLFEAAIRALDGTKVTCYVDALDECDDQQARDMVESFEAFGQFAVEANMEFRVLFSSRHYPHITIATCTEMILEGQEGHEADIADYVRCKLKIGKSNLAMEIRDAIRVRASGVFLWVVLVIRILNECDLKGKNHLLKKRLEALPDELSKLFQEILQRRTEDLDDTLLTYQWILFARRPLRREELYFAVATNFEEDDIKDWDPEEITVDIMDRFLLNSSKGLAQSTRGKHPTVQFIHESVREYLLNDGLDCLEPGLRLAPAQLSHDALWRCCHHYLLKSKAALLPTAAGGIKKHMSSSSQVINALRARIATTHPFLGYAVAGVLHHADLALLGPHSQDAFAAAFPHGLWQRLYNLNCQYHSRRLFHACPLAYKCVLMNAHNMAVSEIRKEPSYATELFIDEYHPSLLGAAIANGNCKIMKLLLEYGADPHGRVNLTKNDCFEFAIEQKNASMVQILIDGGAEVLRDLHTSRYSCYLVLALDCQNHAVIEVILKNEPYSIPTFWQKECTSALIWSNDHSTIEQTLLAKLDAISADLASTDKGLIPERYVEAFVAACSHGIVPLIIRFLDHGIWNLKDFVPRAMQAAVTQGRLEAVQTMLDHGVPVDLHLDATEGTTLKLALEMRQHGIFKLLLERGADVNCRTNGQNVLHFASRYGYADMMRLLLHCPRTDADALDYNGNHAITLAASCGNVGCARALLESVIPAEHINKALGWATRKGYGQIEAILRRHNHASRNLDEGHAQVVHID